MRATRIQPFIAPLALVLAAITAVQATRASVPLSPSQAATAIPGPRSAHCLVYDQQQRYVVLVAGSFRPAAASPTGQSDRTELWSWQGKQWERVPRSDLTERYLNGGAVYDSRRKKIVSFWGRDPNREELTWEWDGNRWNQSAEIGSGIPLHYATAYDAARGSIIRYGGTFVGRSGPWPTDTWEWDGTRWALLARQGPAGRGLGCGSMVYDSKRKQIVLFGGIGEASGTGQPQPLYNDTWVWDWDNKAWRKTSEEGPRARVAHSMAFDSRAGETLLYGGGTLTDRFDDMWRWDGQRWTEIKLTGSGPGPRAGHALAYDAARRRTILYGGNVGPNKVLGDTWEWDGRRWEEIK